MSRLTHDERRRVYVAQQRVRGTTRARREAEAAEALDRSRDQRLLGWIVGAAMIALMLGGGLLAAPTLTFHPADSLLDALLPRV